MDPFCGTGTILIEGGLIAKNIAPGINRSFNSEKWTLFHSSDWPSERENARGLIKNDAEYRIFGSDINPKALSIANKNIHLAGLSNIFVQKRSIMEVSSRFDCGKLITNPPYGERLEDEQTIEGLYQEMGQVFRREFPYWSYYILSSNEEFDYFFGAKSTKNRKSLSPRTK